jgi:membrane protease YdiL (CAAX protease family)
VENNSTWTPSAPSPTPWPSNAFPIAATIVATLGALAVAILPGLAYTWYAVGAKIIPQHANFMQIPVRVLLISQLISYVPLIAYLLVVVPRLACRSLAELGVRRPTARDIGTGIIGTFAMWFLVALASAILTAITHERAIETAVQLLRALRTPADIISFIAIAVVFAPMVEEFAFRVFLLNAISSHTSIRTGVLGCSVLFGVVHGTGVSVAIPLTIGGIVLALIYVRTGCYWSNVVTHALFNAVSVIAVLVFHVVS